MSCQPVLNICYYERCRIWTHAAATYVWSLPNSHPISKHFVCRTSKLRNTTMEIKKIHNFCVLHGSQPHWNFNRVILHYGMNVIFVLFKNFSILFTVQDTVLYSIICWIKMMLCWRWTRLCCSAGRWAAASLTGCWGSGATAARTPPPPPTSTRTIMIP